MLMPTKKTVALIEFPIYRQFPIVSGYLQAYSLTEKVIADTYEFKYYQEAISEIQYGSTIRNIYNLNASILCFSCYVWNIGLVMKLVKELAPNDKIDKIILGGHQISEHFTRYFSEKDEKIIVVNGPGEVPFKDTLIAIQDDGSLDAVSGISTFIEGELYNGGYGRYITDLDSIPSPFLTGLFDNQQYSTTIFETNRGCPFQCSFCTWGGATVKVNKFSMDRIKEELTWISKKQTIFIFIADANWGMLPRDVEISEYIGKLKQENGAPWGVYYASSKNTPERSTECVRAFHKSGLMTAQAIGIQSLNNDTLIAIDRKNIKNELYFDMFNKLSEEGISCYCELIWPLPLETLDSLKASFEKLIRLNSPTVIMYPSLLINNSKLSEEKEKYNMDVSEDMDDNSELKRVISTSTACADDVDQGLWFYYSHFILGNCDCFKSLYKFGERILGIDIKTTITEFSKYLQTEAKESEYSKLIGELFIKERHGEVLTIGMLATHISHNYRQESQKLVADFILSKYSEYPFERAVLACLWVATLPKVFSNTKNYTKEVILRSSSDLNTFYPSYVNITGQGEIIINPQEYNKELINVLSIYNLKPNINGATIITVSENTKARMRMAATNDQVQNHTYANGMIERLSELTPVISISQ